MGITTSLLLLAVGAIVVAVTTYNTVGWILVAVGALGILLSLIFWSAWGGFGAREGAPPHHRHRGIAPRVTGEGPADTSALAYTSRVAATTQLRGSSRGRGGRRRPRAATSIVMKFGGTSVGDTEKIKDVARRLVARPRVGPSRRRRALRDGRHDRRPDPRSRTRSRRSRIRASTTCSSRSASGSRTRSARWRSATSATRPSRSRARRRASSPTPSHGKAKIVEVRARRLQRRARPRPDRARRRLPGRLDRARGDDARPRRLRRDRGRARLGARRRVRDLHRRRGRLHRRPAHRPGRAEAADGSPTRRCSRWRRPARA